MRLISRRTGRRRADDTAALEMSHPSFRVILKTPEKETSMIALGAIHSYVRWLSDRELLSKTVSGIVDASSRAGRPDYSGDAHRQLEALFDECDRRSPNGHMWEVALNLASYTGHAVAA